MFSTTADGASSPTERLRIDSSGKLLIGTSSSRTNFYNAGANSAQLQNEGTSYITATISSVCNSTTHGPYLLFGRSRGTSTGSNDIVQSNDSLGIIDFLGADGSRLRQGGRIGCEVDGTPGVGDMPGRLVFSTTADNASNPTERMRIDSSGNVGIGTTSINSNLHISPASDDTFSNGLRVQRASTSSQYGVFNYSGGALNIVATDVAGSTPVTRFFRSTNGTTTTESMRIDSSGNVGIGTSSPGANLHVVEAGSFSNVIASSNVSDTSLASRFALGNSVGTQRFTINMKGGGGEEAYLGSEGNFPIYFQTHGIERMRIDSSGNVGIGGTPTVLSGQNYLSVHSPGSSTNIAGVDFYVSGTREASIISYPSNSEALRIAGLTNRPVTFHANNTERMRIASNGQVSIAHGNSGVAALFLNATDSAYSDNVQQNRVSRAANSGFVFLSCRTNAGGDIEFNLRGDGNAYADGSWNGGGADYAEYFEWSDGNLAVEDRRGISVVLDGDQIREAVVGEEPIGVISGNPSVVGDSAWNKWNGKYLRDEYGTYIQEDYEVEDDDGNTVVQQRRKLNPDYNPDVEYVSREDRPEWDCVGLMGKLRIRKGQVTGSRWIKMRDINDSVEEWLVR